MTEQMRQASAVAQSDVVTIVQPDGLSLATVAQIVAVPMAQLAALSATLQAQASAIAALQSAPDPCLRLSGTIAPMTVQAGSVDVLVTVPGLMRSDVVTIEGEADLPAGIAIGAYHPARDRDNTLVVQIVAVVAAVVLKASVPLTVVALR